MLLHRRRRGLRAGPGLRPRRASVAAAAALAVLAFACGTARAQDPETAPLPRDGAFAGSAECIRCHDRQHRRLLDGLHGAVLQVAELPGCETCHGPGKAHADDGDPLRITLPALLPPAAQTALCSRCHQDQIARHGGDPQGFVAAGLTCTDCHSVHGKARERENAGLAFATREAAVAHAEPAGSARCVDCHPLRDASLQGSGHAALRTEAAANGCETCHGDGSLHAEHGEGRLITRPDRADDGIATCRSCHAAVDATEFHWQGRPKPYLSAQDVRCTTCHRVHDAARAATPAHGEPATNRVCTTCHAAAFPTMHGSTHQRLGGLDTPLPQGCGACHQGALAHARAGGRRDLLATWRDDAKAQAAVCLQCHDDDDSLRHVRAGSHLRQGVSCTDCHGPLHGARHGATAEHAERACATCHAAVAAQFAQPNHHPVPEGRMRCSSCHDVHGARPRLRDLALQQDRCVECHARYRGPFTFAHQAGRRDGCVTCHVPHGSPNRRLLQQATAQQNCLQCHGDFPAFHDQTSGAVFTNCLRCHTEVHGSNHARYLFR